jgi:hypothetical protein
MGIENNKEPQTELWVHDRGRNISFGDTVDEVANAYSLFLEVCHPDHLKLFKNRLRSDPDAAKAEAVVFSWLRWQRYEPHVAESPGSGGVDYLCASESKKPFFIEVTHLNRDAVARQSEWPDELSEVARIFSMITPKLSSKTRAMASQLAEQGAPRILAEVPQDARPGAWAPPSGPMVALWCEARDAPGRPGPPPCPAAPWRLGSRTGLWTVAGWGMRHSRGVAGSGSGGRHS